MVSVYGGSFQRLLIVLKKSLENGLCINLFVGLMNRLVKNRRFKEILNLFKQMEGQGFHSDAVIYDSTVRAFCRYGYCSSADIFILCLILDKMLARKEEIYLINMDHMVLSVCAIP